jgi:hypothetical protein
MKGAEAALDGAEESWIAQIESVSAKKRRKDMLHKLIRDNRLMSEKLLASEKDRRRTEIVAGGIAALKAHVDALNQRLGKPYMPPVTGDFAGAVKGLKSLTSMEDKVSTELARAKITANEIADRIDANLKHLREHAAQYAHLFPDTAAIVLKAPDDLQALATARISEHKAAEERRAAELAERERARIRAEEEARAAAKVRQEQEEAARAERQRQEQEALEARQREAVTARNEPQREEAAAPAPAANVLPMPTKAPAPATSAPTLRLGVINERIAPLSIDDAGLTALGFPPAATEKNAKLRHEADFPRICLALVQRLQAAARQQEAA